MCEVCFSVYPDTKAFAVWCCCVLVEKGKEGRGRLAREGKHKHFLQIINLSWRRTEKACDRRRRLEGNSRIDSCSCRSQNSTLNGTGSGKCCVSVSEVLEVEVETLSFLFVFVCYFSPNLYMKNMIFFFTFAFLLSMNFGRSLVVKRFKCE